MRRIILALVLGAVCAGGAYAAGAPRKIRDVSGVNGTIEDVANALGMVRGTGQTTNRGVIAVRYTASGVRVIDGKTYHVKEVTADIAQYVPATRMEWQLVDDKGVATHRIEVARDGLAWNETTPGMGASAAPGQAQARMRQVWLYPHAVIWAAIDAGGGKVDQATAGGKTVLTVPSPVDGVPIKVTLGADKRPERVETRQNGQPLTVDFSDYKDLEIYQVFFPHHIVEKLGNKVVLDLTVSGGHTNPYLAFPIPDVARSQASAGKGS